MNADAGFKRRGTGGEFRGIFAKALLQAQRCLRSPAGDDPRCGGRAEKGKDAVAGGLHYVSVVALDSVDHQLQRRVDDRARFFWIEVLHQLG